VVITDSEIALTLPLWIDPLDPPPKRSVRFLILLIPVVVFAFTVGVILYCWRLPEAFEDLSGFDHAVYITYYLLSAGIFIFGFRRLLGTVRTYDNPTHGRSPRPDTDTIEVPA
jgi:nitrogen fixation-related uncharacterized protein